VRTGDYHVFLSAEGDSRGLYVRRKARWGFEVREQAGGSSSVRFSYRIVARRRDIAGPRLPKVKVLGRSQLPDVRRKLALGQRAPQQRRAPR
jgi:hypothetical protein